MYLRNAVNIRQFVLLAFFSLSLYNASDAADPSGKWRGRWSSQATGHSGVLRARIRQVDATTYRALFSGRFATVIPFVYPAKLTRVPGTYSQFSSSTWFPGLGEYRMNATVTPNTFDAVFRGRSDSGRFQMSR
ncbi:MAG: hypothetical protein AAF802_07470 [Planctomycetota bacterium]